MRNLLAGCNAQQSSRKCSVICLNKKVYGAQRGKTTQDGVLITRTFTAAKGRARFSVMASREPDAGAISAASGVFMIFLRSYLLRYDGCYINFKQHALDREAADDKKCIGRNGA